MRKSERETEENKNGRGRKTGVGKNQNQINKQACGLLETLKVKKIRDGGGGGKGIENNNRSPSFRHSFHMGWARSGDQQAGAFKAKHLNIF